MPTGRRAFPLRRLAAVLLLLSLPRLAVSADPDPAAAVDRAVTAAEASLQKGDLAGAQRHYGEALFEGWLLMATLDRLDQHMTEARDALAKAAASAGDDPQALRPLAKAWAGAGDLPRAVQALDDAVKASPEDPETAFLLATEYLWLKQTGPAERLFARAVAGRPVPALHVLIGRSYRDAGDYARARAELGTALAQDPRVRHAHYYLGMVTLADATTSADRLEKAMAEFREELTLAPDDPLASHQLGVTLLDAGRAAEALPPLEVAVRADARALYVYQVGRAQLALDRPAEAAVALRRALQLGPDQGASAGDLGKIHYQLGLALRKLGAPDAGAHLADARRLSAEVDDGGIPPAQRAALRERVRSALARTYLNLGVMEAQKQRFAEAAELFDKAAGIDPGFPQVQSSLGIAYFNARQLDKATGPLALALAAAPGDRGLKRMLALAWLDTGTYPKAAELLADDPERESDPSLQFAYGLALVKSERAAEAEGVFSRLLRAHGDSAELSVFLGQAYAQQGNFEAATVSLKRALALSAEVAEASGTLGEIYLRQGRMAEAEEALRAELKGHPSDFRARQNLAIVLEAEQKGGEAVPLLREVLASKPESAEARYLLGKILLGQGAVAEATSNLEAAARVAPGDANIHYQLGRAYQKAGQTDRAEREFEKFRELKARN